MSSPPKYNELLQKFEAEENSPIGEKLLFEGVGKNDVYNISAPFHIGDETIFGGVEVYPNHTIHDPQGIGYRTVFYHGYDFSSLRKFAEGPDMMKDIRLVQLANGKLGVFTRPQGGLNGRGKMVIPNS